jgi:hypothetical protein
MKNRKATASSVSRLLAQKFTRGTSYASQIRGLSNTSAGFVVGYAAVGAQVWHQCGWGHSGDREETIKRRIKEYAQFLADHYDVNNYETTLLIKEKST